MLLRLSLGLSVLLFLALAVLSKSWLEEGGMVIFDSRVLGYDRGTAEALIEALKEEQLALYLGLFRLLDTLFPIALCLTLLLLARRLGGIVAVLAGAAALAYLFFDLRENALVAEMLRSGTDLTDTLVASASSATLLKWTTLAASALCLLAACAVNRRKEARP